MAFPPPMLDKKPAAPKEKKPKMATGKGASAAK